MDICDTTVEEQAPIPKCRRYVTELTALIHISANRFVAVYFSVLEILREFEGSEDKRVETLFQMYTACSSELTVAAKLLKNLNYSNYCGEI